MNYAHILRQEVDCAVRTGINPWIYKILAGVQVGNWGSFLEWNAGQFQLDRNCHAIRRILPTMLALGSQSNHGNGTLEGASTENKAFLRRLAETKVTSGFGQASAISKATGSYMTRDF